MTEQNINIEFQPKPTKGYFTDIEGKIFGVWTVLGYAGQNKYYQHLWFCRCFCGTIKPLSKTRIQAKSVKSCGCARPKMKPFSTIKHGELVGGKKTTEYTAYQSAKQRCNYPKARFYKNYGGRGIEFRFNSFEDFLAEVGRKPTPKHSLERIDVNGHYEKGNIRWATMKEQSSNTTHNVFITAQKQTLTLAQWSEKTGFHVTAIRSRFVRSKWCGECSVDKEIKHCPHR
jgi:hypothetical protein